MKAAHPRVSCVHLERWPDDSRRYELYDGEVSASSADTRASDRRGLRALTASNRRFFLNAL